jgi:murein L,D-transpeptidase YafK
MYSQSKTILGDSVTIFNPKSKRQYILLFFILLNFAGMAQSTVKKEQHHLSRVKQAYATHLVQLNTVLSNLKIEISSLELYIRAYKYEETLEVFVKNKSDEKYIRLFEFPFCVLSGGLGPKRKQGDFQVPEGIYFIDRFNPWSNFHLSLGINYPNVFDKANALNNNPGGDIFIHGNCVSVGCIPITDNLIELLYIVALEANHNGQSKIPVHIFPQRLSSIPYLTTASWWKPLHNDYHELWQQLAAVDRYFNETHTLPKISITKQGYFIDHSN